MEFLDLIVKNLSSAPILFFVLGCIAGFVKSDLKVPDSISRYLSIYLMMAIGFKGGVAIACTEEFTLQVLGVVFFGIAASFLQPFLSYGLLRFTSKLDSPTAAAVAAHYGSISMVTFVTATVFLSENTINYEGYIVAVLALMEAPAIIAGLFIAHKTAPQTATHAQEEHKLKREIFTNGAILLLFGAFLIGWITGKPGMAQVEGFLKTPFQGFLCLFLLDMGLAVTKNIGHLKSFSLPLVLFAFYMPLIGAGIGLGIAKMLGLDLGTGTLFIVLCASASYIAVPAAMRLALPEAKEAIYLPMSLALTFPFNVVFGIPLYYEAAKLIL